MLYISARISMHAYEPRPHLFVDLYGGYNYLPSAEWWSYTSLPFFEDSRQVSVLRDPYGLGKLKLVLGHVR